MAKRTRLTIRSNSGCSSEEDSSNSNNNIYHNSKRTKTEQHTTNNTSNLTQNLVQNNDLFAPLKDHSRIYNFGYRKKPAELFRKDLISAMKLADTEQLNEAEYITITDPWKEEWEKGVQVPVNPEALPTASFRLIGNSHTNNSNNGLTNDSNSAIVTDPIGKVKQESESTPSTFKMPKDYIKDRGSRHTDHLKYELDLIDLSWRELMSDTCVPRISESLIEDVITELERQCAENMKNHKIGIEFNDAVVCDVCRSPYSEEGNEMVFCDSCNVCVHQACYGVEDIPEGDWYCQPCKELGKSDKASCILCPNKNGAMKRTPEDHWAHVSCSLWVVSQIDGDHKDGTQVSCKKNNKSKKK